MASHQTPKPWAIYYQPPNVIKPHRLGLYSQRSEAEQSALAFRRQLPRLTTVRVVWVGEEFQ
jgi:hypothetical protein